MTVYVLKRAASRGEVIDGAYAYVIGVYSTWELADEQAMRADGRHDWVQRGDNRWESVPTPTHSKFIISAWEIDTPVSVGEKKGTK